MEGLLRIQLTNNIRPVINVTTENDDIKCLIDTGANISVFTEDYGMLKSYFPNAKKVPNVEVKLSGFGEGESDAIFCCIDKIRIKSTIDNDYIDIRDLYVACCDRPDIGVALVLSYGSFDELGLAITMKMGNIRELQIQHNKVVYYGNYRKGINNDRNAVKRTSVHSQNGYYIKGGQHEQHRQNI